MREVVLSLRVPNNWVSEISEGHPATVRLLDCRPLRDQQGIHQLVEIRAADTPIHKLIKGIRRNPYIRHAEVVETKSGRAVGAVFTEGSIICSAVAESRLFCRTCLFTAKPKEDGTVEWTVALNGRRELTHLLQRLEKHEVAVRVVRVTELADVMQLTPRQEEIVAAAFERGFFDFPRRVGLRSLAHDLQISAASLSEILRRAEKKIIGEFVKRGPQMAA